MRPCDRDLKSILTGDRTDSPPITTSPSASVPQNGGGLLIQELTLPNRRAQRIFVNPSHPALCFSDEETKAQR